MNRFFVSPDQVNDSVITIVSSDANHLKNVLHKRIGDEIVCFDGQGNEYISNITLIEKGKVELSVVFAKHMPNEIKVKKVLAQGLPKHTKMDEIIKKSTELGIDRVIPILTERSIAKADKLERWRKIAKEASQQSGRLTVPEISDLVTFDELLETVKEYKLKLLPYEGEKIRNIKTELRKHPNADSVIVLIGPEGGFSADEVARASAKGFKIVSLGKHILRTETAGPAVIAMINYELELH